MPTPARVAVSQYNFYYRVSGEEAQRLLLEYGEEGDFLTRYSESNRQTFSVTVRAGDNRVVHMKINKLENDSLSIHDFDKQDETFDGIRNLLEYYIANPDKLVEKRGHIMTLKKPVYIPFTKEACAREQRLTQVYRWFHANLTSPEATKIFKDKKAEGTFLVRHSQHTPGALIITARANDGSLVNLSVYQDYRTGMYRVDCMSTQYREMAEILAYHKTVPIVDTNGKVVFLKVPINCTYFPADILPDRYELLRRTLVDNSATTGTMQEFDNLQAMVVFNERVNHKGEAKKDHNLAKNRYKNIIPYDKSRVKLADASADKKVDYINASYIKFHNFKNRKPVVDNPEKIAFAFEQLYIATQGCMENTCLDLWRMVWQEKSRLIIMATRLVEKNAQEKCTLYFPTNEERTVIFGHFKITLENEEAVQRNIPDNLRAEFDKEDRTDETVYYIRRFNVHNQEIGGEPFRVTQFHYVAWPDHGVPAHPYEVIKFLKQCDEEQQGYMRAGMDIGPNIVHCSAGIGRTGTFMVLDHLLNQFKVGGWGWSVDVEKTVFHSRDCRSGMVQTEQQYDFIYQALAWYIKDELKIPDDMKFMTKERLDKEFPHLSGIVRPRGPENQRGTGTPEREVHEGPVTRSVARQSTLPAGSSSGSPRGVGPSSSSSSPGVSGTSTLPSRRSGSRNVPSRGSPK